MWHRVSVKMTCDEIVWKGDYVAIIERRRETKNRPKRDQRGTKEGPKTKKGPKRDQRGTKEGPKKEKEEEK